MQNFLGIFLFHLPFYISTLLGTYFKGPKINAIKRMICKLNEKFTDVRKDKALRHFYVNFLVEICQQIEISWLLRLPQNSF